MDCDIRVWRALSAHETGNSVSDNEHTGAACKVTPLLPVEISFLLNFTRI